MSPPDSPRSTTSAITVLPPARVHNVSSPLDSRPNLDSVARRSFCKHLIEASSEECQHSSEAPTPSFLSARSSLKASLDLSPSSPLTLCKGEGKGRSAWVDSESNQQVCYSSRAKNRPDSMNHFGNSLQQAESNASEGLHDSEDKSAEEPRAKPHTPVRHEGFGNGKEGPIWGSESPDHNVASLSNDDYNGYQVVGGNGDVGARWSERKATQSGWENGKNNGGWGPMGAEGSEWSVGTGVPLVLDPKNNYHGEVNRQSHDNCLGQDQGWGNKSGHHVDRVPNANGCEGKNPNPYEWGISYREQKPWGNIEEDGKVFDQNKNQGWGQSYDNGNQDAHRFGQQDYARERHGSQATLRPDAQHQQQYCQPENHHQGRAQQYGQQEKTSFPKAPILCQHEHQHTHNYDRYLQNQHSSKTEAGMERLHAQYQSQTETLTEQRIRIAVLENDAKHITQGKQDAMNASVIIAQTLGAALQVQISSSAITGTSRRVVRELDSKETLGKVEELKAKLRSLEKENFHLRRKNEECKEGIHQRRLVKHAPKTFLSLSRTVAKGDSFLLDDSSEDNSKPNNQVDEQKKRQTALPSPAAYQAQRLELRGGQGLRAAYEKDKALAGRQAETSTQVVFPNAVIEPATDTTTATPHPVIKGATGWNESFKSKPEIPTVPNSPILNPSSIANTQFDISVTDVGFHSLDELIGDEESSPNDVALQPGDHLLGNIGPNAQGLELQIQEQMRAIQNRPAAPAPKVLKTGTDLANSFRGNNYAQSGGQPPTEPRSMWNYNRFQDPTTINLPSDIDHTNKESSPGDKEASLRIHKQGAKDEERRTGRTGPLFPDYFRYDIQYVPQEDEDNYLRTVSISNLPANITLREVLCRVRGGKIANAILMDTRKLMGGCMSALVKFVEDYDARAFVDHAVDNPVTFGEDDDLCTAVVALIPTPTYPPNQGLIACLRRDVQTSRCLMIQNCSRSLQIARLQEHLACGRGIHSESLLEMFMDEDRTLHLEFSGISIAGSSLGILRKWPGCRNLKVENARDPCVGSLEELALPIPPRPPIFPRNANGSFDSDQDSADSSFESSTERETHFAFRAQPAQLPHTRRFFLNPQPVVIPSCSGADLKSSSWADEVEESACAENEAMTARQPGLKTAAHLLMATDINRSMEQDPSLFSQGLAGSRNAPPHTFPESNLSKENIQTSKFRPHPELEPSRLLAAFIGSDTESSRRSSIVSEYLPEEEIRQAHTPSPYHSPSRKSKGVAFGNSPSYSPDATPKPTSTRLPQGTLHLGELTRAYDGTETDSYYITPSNCTTDRDFEPSPSDSPVFPEKHTTVLENFSQAINEKEGVSSAGPSYLTSPYENPVLVDGERVNPDEIELDLD